MSPTFNPPQGTVNHAYKAAEAGKGLFQMKERERKREREREREKERRKSKQQIDDKEIENLKYGHYLNRKCTIILK